MKFLEKSEGPTRRDFLAELTKQLVRQRRHLGWTQEKLNYRLGVADRLVNKWECGDKTPSGFNLFCWADAIGAELMVIPLQMQVKIRDLLEEYYGQDAADKR